MEKNDSSHVSWRISWLHSGFAARPGFWSFSTYASYAIEKKISRHPEEFGHGAIEGVAGPEAAFNNSAVAGMLVILLSLGLPFWTLCVAARRLKHACHFPRTDVHPKEPGDILGLHRQFVLGKYGVACAESTLGRAYGLVFTHPCTLLNAFDLPTLPRGDIHTQ